MRFVLHVPDRPIMSNPSRGVLWSYIAAKVRIDGTTQRRLLVGL